MRRGGEGKKEQEANLDAKDAKGKKEGKGETLPQRPASANSGASVSACTVVASSGSSTCAGPCGGKVLCAGEEEEEGAKEK